MAKLAIDANSKPIQVLRPKTSQTVSVSSVSAQSSAFSPKVRVIRLCATTDCYYTLESATATSSDVLLPAGTVEYIHVFGAEQIAVLRFAVDGVLHITEME